MDQSFEKEVERFQAVDDNGKKYTVIVMQEFIRARHMLGEEIIPGMKRLVTSAGLFLNFISDDTFEVVQTGQTIRKI